MAPFDKEGLKEIISKNEKPLQTALKQCENEVDKKAVLNIFATDHSKKILKETMDVSMRQIDNSRKKRKNVGLGGTEENKKIRRNRLDLVKVEHFIDWMFETNVFAEAAYGTTMILLDSGAKQTVPKAVLTMAKLRLIKLYHDRCLRSAFVPLSTSTCERILLKLKPSQRKSLAAMDNFLVDCIEAFRTLKGIIQECHMSVDLRKELLSKIRLSEQYVRGGFINNCSKSTNIKSHCIVCGISDPIKKEFNEYCEKVHDLQCSDCVMVVETLKEINSCLKKQFDSHDLHFYDFHKCQEKIIDYMKHCMRSKQQRQAKEYCKDQCKKDSSTALWIADWGQKVLPMRHRESMQQYFAKNGMSIHADCFLIYDQEWKIFTYVTCIDKCDQSMKDVVCLSDSVLTQFSKDHPHVKTLFRKTDRAGCYTANGYV